MMRSLLRGLWTGLFILWTAVFFQNCGGQLSVFSGHGNGDPYEGMKDPGNAGNAPSDGIDVSDVDPDQGADTTLVLRCESSDVVVPQIWMVKSLHSSNHYLIATFVDANNQIREKAILWSKTSAFEERDLHWSLRADLEVAHIKIQPAFATLMIQNLKKAPQTLSFQCSQ